MILLLTMAGKYSRFREFSYEIPKYFLPLSNRTVIHYVLDTLLESGKFDDVILAANIRDERFRPQLISTLSEFGLGVDNIKFIEDTPGQSITALEALSNLSDNPVAIHNIDTILLGRDYTKVQKSIYQYDCILDAFHANNSSYSYILEGERSSVSAIVEKEVVSNIASSGCYFFNSLKKFCDYSKIAANDRQYYISAAITKMIEAGLSVKKTKTHSEDSTVVLGTPSEYITSIGTFDLLYNHYRRSNK